MRIVAKLAKVLLGSNQPTKQKWTLRGFVLLGAFFVFGLLVVPVHAGSDGLGGDIARILAYPTYFFMSLIGRLTVQVIDILVQVAQYNDFVHAAAVAKGWIIVRDVANMFFIFIMLVIAFGTLFRMEKYRYQVLLRQVILMALLINFSKTICLFFIDLVQVIMLTFVHAFASAAAGNLTGAVGLKDFLEISPASNAGEISGGEVFGTILLALILSIILFFVVLVYLIIFLTRIVALWVLIILSPIAFILSAFPSTKGRSTEWWQQFWKYATIGPILAFFLWLTLAITAPSSTVTQTADLLGSTGTTASGVKSTFDTSAPDASGKVEKFSSALSTVSSSRGLLSFVIAIILLVVSLQIAQKSGVAGGALAGKLASNIQKQGLAIPRGAALLGYNKMLRRPVEGTASAALGGLGGLGIPLVSTLARSGHIKLRQRDEKMKEQQKKETQAIDASGKVGKFLLGGQTRDSLITKALFLGQDRRIGKIYDEKISGSRVAGLLGIQGKKFGEKGIGRALDSGARVRFDEAKKANPSILSVKDMVDTIKKADPADINFRKPILDQIYEKLVGTKGEVDKDGNWTGAVDEKGNRVEEFTKGMPISYIPGLEVLGKRILNSGSAEKIAAVGLTDWKWNQREGKITKKNEPDSGGGGDQIPSVNRAKFDATHAARGQHASDEAFFASKAYKDGVAKGTFLDEKEYSQARFRHQRQQEGIANGTLRPNEISVGRADQVDLTGQTVNLALNGSDARFGFLGMQDSGASGMHVTDQGQKEQLADAAYREYTSGDRFQQEVDRRYNVLRNQDAANKVPHNEEARRAEATAQARVGAETLRNNILGAASVNVGDKMGLGSFAHDMTHEEGHGKVETLEKEKKQELYEMIPADRRNGLEAQVRSEWANGAKMSTQEVMDEILSELYASSKSIARETVKKGSEELALRGDQRGRLAFSGADEGDIALFLRSAIADAKRAGGNAAAQRAEKSASEASSRQKRGGVKPIAQRIAEQNAAKPKPSSPRPTSPPSPPPPPPPPTS